MLIPRFTIRTMLVITTICAVVASMIAWAMEGAAWAAAVASGVGLAAAAFLIYGLLFLVAFGFAALRPRRTAVAESADSLPPAA